MGLTVGRPVLNEGVGGYYLASAESSPRPLLQIEIDSSGVIQAIDGDWPNLRQELSVGSNYLSSLNILCGGNAARAETVRAGIRAVSFRQADSFSLEFGCYVSNRETQVHLSAAPRPNGTLEGVLLTLSDAAAAADPQEYKMEALGRLAGGVAHDFANLITLISGYTDVLLRRTSVWDPNRPELEEIGRASARGAAVTSQILDFIRKQEASPSEVQLNALVAEMVSLLRPIIGEHISLAMTLDPALGAVNVGLCR